MFMRIFIGELENNTRKKLKQDTVWQLVVCGRIILKWLQIICLLVCVLGNGPSRYNPLSSSCRYGNEPSGYILV
jgi:hypothetical protein